VIRNTDLGMTGPGIWVRLLLHHRQKESMETGTRSGLIPIRGANPHGAAYSFNVIPGKETHTVSEYAKRLEKGRC
jgi:hypothetical protein